MECFAKERLRVKSRTPERDEREGKEPRRIETKKKVAGRELLIDIESESEMFSYWSISSICISAKVKETLLWALINCRAEGDMILEKGVEEKNLLILLIQPVRVGQALAKAGKITVNRKV